MIARGLNLPPGEVELILHASRMHDVGKIAVPDSILRKPSSLDGAEWVVMRRHPMIGSRILDNSSSELLQAGRVIALCHHERWDGIGYPNGIVGTSIPLWGRICAVADVFDAVTSERPYKPAYSIEEALRILREGRGTQFDPQVVDVFFDQLDEILAVVAEYQDKNNVSTRLRFAYFRVIFTPPFDVFTRSVGPPLPRSVENERPIFPWTVTGKSILTDPFTVPVSRCAE